MNIVFPSSLPQILHFLSNTSIIEKKRNQSTRCVLRFGAINNIYKINDHRKLPKRTTKIGISA